MTYAVQTPYNLKYDIITQISREKTIKKLT